MPSRKEHYGIKCYDICLTLFDTLKKLSMNSFLYPEKREKKYGLNKIQIHVPLILVKTFKRKEVDQKVLFPTIKFTIKLGPEKQTPIQNI